jgi:hypothetical protein
MNILLMSVCFDFCLGGMMTDAYGVPFDYSSTTTYGNDDGVLATMSNHHTYILDPTTKQLTKNEPQQKL